MKLLICFVVVRRRYIQIRERNILEAALDTCVVALDCVVNHHESDKRIAVMSARLTRWLYDRTVVGYAKLTAIMNA